MVFAHAPYIQTAKKRLGFRTLVLFILNHGLYANIERVEHTQHGGRLYQSHQFFFLLNCLLTSSRRISRKLKAYFAESLCRETYWFIDVVNVSSYMTLTVNVLCCVSFSSDKMGLNFECELHIKAKIEGSALQYTYTPQP